MIFLKLYPNHLFHFFADDTNIYFEPKNLQQLQKVINKELKCPKKCTDANKFALNVDKTSLIIFYSPQKYLNDYVNIKFGKIMLVG